MKKFLAFLLAMSMIPLTFISSNAAVWGDADGDGKLTINDVTETLNIVLNGGSYASNVDVSCDGVIDSEDAAIILQKLLNSSYIMPIETMSTTEETTTEETTTEQTTAAPISGVITNAYELTPEKFSKGEEFFKKTGDFLSSNAEKIRLTGTNSLTFTVAKGANVYITARHASNTDSVSRTLSLKTQSGKLVAEKSYQMGADYEEKLYAVKLEGTYVLTSSNHMNISSVRVTFEDIEIPTETTTVHELPDVPTEITTTGNAVNVSNFSELKSAVEKTNVDIYIQNDIDCSAQLKLSNSDAKVNIIGVTQADGTAPSLNFATFRDSVTSSGSGGTGIRVSGSGYSFENIIVENAPDCGMRITGSGSGKCFVKNCIFRYNNNSGISVTSGGANNTFIAVDSYRNGDIVQKCGDDADGFSVKLGAGDNNYYYNCRAWENSDDGWDSYESSPMVGSVYYIECLAWNNGNPNVFTGEYDYKNGYPLDKGLLYVQQILREQPDFETKYNNKEVTSWPRVTITLYGNKTRTYEQLLSTLWGGNPNGFKFGSKATPASSYRYVENCIAFDHVDNAHQTPAKGYDQNSGSASYDIINGLSFDNQQNYWMDKMTALSQTGNALSFNGGQDDTTNDSLELTTPSAAEQEALRAKVHQYRDNLYSKVYNDIIPGIVLCDVF